MFLVQELGSDLLKINLIISMLHFSHFDDTKLWNYGNYGASHGFYIKFI
jgi:hypothetical protein